MPIRRRPPTHRGVQVPQCRPGLHLADALLRAGAGLRPLPQALHRARRRDQARRRARAGRHHGAARQCAPARRHGGDRQRQQEPRRQDRDRRQAARQPGLFLRADRDHRRPGRLQADDAGAVRPDRPVVTFKSFDEVVERANSLEFGLAAYAFTSSAQTATAIGDALDAGMVGVNSIMISTPETPFGGVKESATATKAASRAWKPTWCGSSSRRREYPGRPYRGATAPVSRRVLRSPMSAKRIVSDRRRRSAASLDITARKPAGGSRFVPRDRAVALHRRAACAPLAPGPADSPAPRDGPDCGAESKWPGVSPAIAICSIGASPSVQRLDLDDRGAVIVADPQHRPRPGLLHEHAADIGRVGQQIFDDLVGLRVEPRDLVASASSRSTLPRRPWSAPRRRASVQAVGSFHSLICWVAGSNMPMRVAAILREPQLALVVEAAAARA